MSWVFEHSDAEASDRLVLLALADHADDESWSCWPSVPRLARKARVSERTVQRCLRSLAEAGHIEVESQGADVRRADRRPNRYTIRRGDSVTPRSGVTPETERGDNQRADGVTLLSPEPSVEPPVKPSENPSSTAVDRAETERQFEHFWNAYPKRNGKRLGRSDALLHFGRLSIDDRRAAFRGAQHYAAACDAGATIAADAFRWLRKRSFEDWQTPAEPDRRPVPTRRPNPVDATAANGAEFLRIVNGGRA